MLIATSLTTIINITIELAEECGIINWRRAPALNTDASFIEDMADLVVSQFHIGRR